MGTTNQLVQIDTGWIKPEFTSNDDASNQTLSERLSGWLVSVATMDAALESAGSFSKRYINKLTMNDKVAQLRYMDETLPPPDPDDT